LLKTKSGKLEKERQERQRGCKLLKTQNEQMRESRSTEGKEVGAPRPQRIPPGNSDGYQKKALAGKAIRKNMKTKGRQKPS
jgi:hypothetical protein